jgi:hypothetical protein
MSNADPIAELISMLQYLKRRELERVLEAVENLLDSTDDDDDLSMQYTAIRNAFHATGRFGVTQIEMFRPWRNLPQNKRREFGRGYRKALKRLIKMGFRDSGWLRDLMRQLIVTSPFLEALTFEYVMQSFDSMESLVRDQFPGYGVNEFKFLQEVSG